MDKVIVQLKKMSRYAFQTRSEKILGVSGPASAAMEMAITNLVWPGRKILILKTGTFSDRLAQMAQGVGGEVEIFESQPLRPIEPTQVEELLRRQSFDVVAMVHGETSCGVVNPVVQISKIVAGHGALFVVDAVVTLGTRPMEMDRWGIDVVITGGQKGLASIPGVSLIAFSERAWNAIEARKARQSHWCLDALRAQEFWGNRKYHYTAPVPGILALSESLRLLCEETLEKRFFRHMRSSNALQLGIEAMGLELTIPKEYRLDCLVAVNIPDGIDGTLLRSCMVDRFGVEVSGAFGLNILRIGQMAEQCRPHHTYRALFALGMAMSQFGANVNVAKGLTAFESSFAGAHAESG